MDYNIIGTYIIITGLFIGLVMMIKDKAMGPKYIFALKAFMTVMIMIFAMYVYKGKIGILFGLSTGVISVTMFDKDYSDRFIIESIKIIVMQMLIGVAAYFASYNYISLIIISLIIIFIMYFMFTHNGKVSRVKGFLVNYLILIYFNVPRGQEYNTIFQILFVSGLLAIILYYFFNRNIYFKKNSIVNWNFLKGGLSFKKIFHNDDRDSEFRMFVLRHSILSTIAMTGVIFYMKYYGSVESIWIIISVVAMLLPDAELSRKIIIDRVIGTIVGAAIFVILSQFTINTYFIYIMLVVALFFTVFPMSYQKNALFLTYLTLELHSMVSKLTPLYLAKYRIGFTIIGAVIVLVIFLIDNNLKLVSSEKEVI